jgi:hypothetical protein
MKEITRAIIRAINWRWALTRRARQSKAAAAAAPRVSRPRAPSRIRRSAAGAPRASWARQTHQAPSEPACRTRAHGQCAVSLQLRNAPTQFGHKPAAGRTSDSVGAGGVGAGGGDGDMCVCARARVRACACACVCVYTRTCMHMEQQVQVCKHCCAAARAGKCGATAGGAHEPLQSRDAHGVTAVVEPRQEVLDRRGRREWHARHGDDGRLAHVPARARDGAESAAWARHAPSRAAGCRAGGKKRAHRSGRTNSRRQTNR